VRAQEFGNLGNDGKAPSEGIGRTRALAGQRQEAACVGEEGERCKRTEREGALTRAGDFQRCNPDYRTERKKPKRRSMRMEAARCIGAEKSRRRSRGVSSSMMDCWAGNPASVLRQPTRRYL